MADYLSGQISFTGLGSGTDFQSMIEGLLQIEANHKKNLESWKTQWEGKVEASQELNTAMLNLKTTLSDMNTMNKFMVKDAESNDSTIVTASADSEAQEGSHSVLVNQLAQNAILTTASGFSALTTAVNTSGSEQDFTYTYQGTDYSVNVPHGTDLDNLVDLINNDPNNPGVRATTLYDGSYYYLQLRGLDMGDEASLTFNAAASGLDHPALNDAGDFETTQANQDSQIRIDGWPTGLGSNAWIETDSNTIPDAIEGITLNLRDTSASEVNINITTDTEAIKENVRSFVENINEIRTIIKSLTQVDDVTNVGSVMTGNYAVQLIDSKLKSAIASKGLGFVHYNATTTPPIGDKYSSLSQLGILTDAEQGSPTQGLLVLDEEKLSDALSDEPDTVAQLFSADHVGDETVTSGNFNYYSHVTGITEPGEYDVSYRVDGSGNIYDATINGKAASVSGNFITATADSPERGLVVEVNDLTNSFGSYYSGQVQLKQGKSGEIESLLKDLTSATDGPMHILEENYEDIIKNIDKKISYEEDRLARLERDYKNKFARLEANLGYYEQLQSSLGNQIKQLDSG